MSCSFIGDVRWGMSRCEVINWQLHCAQVYVDVDGGVVETVLKDLTAIHRPSHNSP